MRLLVLLALLGLLGCSKPERVEAPPEALPHYGDAWFAFRGASLGISVAAAQSRDATIPADHPPATLDRTTAVEAAAIYRSVCVVCHGPGGEPPEKQPSGGAPPRAWGGSARMGFFFGGDKMRAGLFKRIQEGGEPRDGKASDMPAWASTLSREQTWALVRHLESF